ncbi:uncharacterized protein LTR77_000429 [Saxophila tyrrhenica]|uniref:Uncharacterized protein n=1 Tax=Saxophila tyrrhenica TaxID=1690608 RepID=A0AAV9PNB1_9PEZI|nr:hypothetical protein LTR77_000429 [Saxophila tyrrhenica]
MVWGLFKKESFSQTARPAQAQRRAAQARSAHSSATVTATTPTPHLDNTKRPKSLGNTVGKFGIRCVLEGSSSRSWPPRWCIAGTDLKGVLYFAVQFNQNGSTPIERARVRISFGKSTNIDPVPWIPEYAPNKEISGPPLIRNEGRNRLFSPQFGVNAASIGGNLSIGEMGSNAQSSPGRSWKFTSGFPSTDSTDVTEVGFEWTRGWDNDYDGLNRKFQTAIVVNRDSIDSLAMAVQVEVKPMTGWRTPGPPPEKKSGPLQPLHNLDEVSFEGVLDSLEDRIQEANQPAAPSATTTTTTTTAGPADPGAAPPQPLQIQFTTGVQAPLPQQPIAGSSSTSVPALQQAIPSVPGSAGRPPASPSPQPQQSPAPPPPAATTPAGSSTPPSIPIPPAAVPLPAQPSGNTTATIP